MSGIVGASLTQRFGSEVGLDGVDLDVDPIKTDLGTEPLRERRADDDAHLPRSSPPSSGVLMRGHRTKGPAKNSSSVATMSVTTRPPDCARGRPPAPTQRAARRRCPGG